MAREKHLIIDTSYGDVMLKETSDDGYLDCYIGDNFDDYIATIEGHFSDDTDELAEKVESQVG